MQKILFSVLIHIITDGDLRALAAVNTAFSLEGLIYGSVMLRFSAKTARWLLFKQTDS